MPKAIKIAIAALVAVVAAVVALDLFPAKESRTLALFDNEATNFTNVEIEGYLFVGDTFTRGGLLATSTVATSTGALKERDLSYSTIFVDHPAGALTYTLPASSTVTSLIPNAGDRIEVLIFNNGTTTITVAGSTGTALKSASSTAVINANGIGILNLVRKPNTDISASIITANN